MIALVSYSNYLPRVFANQVLLKRIANENEENSSINLPKYLNKSDLNIDTPLIGLESFPTWLLIKKTASD